MLERRAAEAAAAEAEFRAKRQHTIAVVSFVVPVAFVAVIVTVMGVFVSLSGSAPAPAAMPSPVHAFAASLPSSQRPDAAGLTVVDGSNAPDSWRVAWETGDAAFCFAFVHQSRPPQTVCGKPGSVETAKMRIAGELIDDGVDPTELFTCGYTTGPEISYVEINDGTVVDTPVDMGSGLSGFCLQLPEGTAPGASFTVSTFYSNGLTGKQFREVPVSATYP